MNMDKKKLNSDTGTDILIIKPIKKRRFFKKLKQKAKGLLVFTDRNSILIGEPIKKRRFFKKLKQKAKGLLVSVDLILVLQSSMNISQAIGLPVLPSSYLSTIKRSQPEFSQFSKKVMIAQILEGKQDKITLTKKEVDLYFDLAMQVKNGSLSQEELITQLRGGAEITDIVLVVGIILGLVAMMKAWTPPIPFPTPYPMPVPHPLNQNNPDQRHFGGQYNSPPSSRYRTQQGATQSANSELNDSLGPSFDYDYIKIMDELDRQAKANYKKVVLHIGGQTYEINNQNNKNVYQLEAVLEEKIYETIRESSTDVDSIAANLKYKPYRIQFIKDHVFINEHCLDRYPDAIEYRRFYPDLKQGLAWLRMERGIPLAEDREWLLHEFTESLYEINRNSSYNPAHIYAEDHFRGNPWGDKGKWTPKNERE